MIILIEARNVLASTAVAGERNYVAATRSLVAAALAAQPQSPRRGIATKVTAGGGGAFSLRATSSELAETHGVDLSIARKALANSEVGGARDFAAAGNALSVGCALFADALQVGAGVVAVTQRAASKHDAFDCAPVQPHVRGPQLT